MVSCASNTEYVMVDAVHSTADNTKVVLFLGQNYAYICYYDLQMMLYNIFGCIFATYCNYILAGVECDLRLMQSH